MVYILYNAVVIGAFIILMISGLGAIWINLIWLKGVLTALFVIVVMNIMYEIWG